MTLPFTRMLAGPMDYTPGGFDNVTRERISSGALRHTHGDGHARAAIGDVCDLSGRFSDGVRSAEGV